MLRRSVEMAMPDRISEIMHPARLYNVEKKMRLAKVVTDFLVFQGTLWVDCVGRCVCVCVCVCVHVFVLGLLMQQCRD